MRLARSTCRIAGKPLPPYGRLLQKYPPINKGVQIYCGHNAWEQAKYFNGNITNWLKYGVINLALPDNVAIERFNWQPCAEMEVSIFNGDGGRGSDDLDNLARLLVKSGATKVVIADINRGISPTYIPKSRVA